MKKLLFLTISTIIVLNTLCAQNYKSVTIGSQTWMEENLNVDKFRNGEPISQAKTLEEFQQMTKAGKPAWCYYENNPDYGAKYGKIYNWAAVNDSRGLAPKGWRVPSVEEWRELLKFTKNDINILKSKEDWKVNGNNQSGFNARPGGYGSGIFAEMGTEACWWSATEMDRDRAWGAVLSSKKGYVDIYYYLKVHGYSVRCIKD